ncbi:MAG TPA: hypothetical protein PKI93_02765 [Alphaproteobacteria bacterium]|nr:hypothetical protein [Alphaproteobacteria bacterium]HNS43899.1 hypothetical protein [Alphaproteobacteria bacterium]
MIVGILAVALRKDFWREASERIAPHVEYIPENKQDAEYLVGEACPDLFESFVQASGRDQVIEAVSVRLNDMMEWEGGYSMSTPENVMETAKRVVRRMNGLG